MTLLYGHQNMGSLPPVLGPSFSDTGMLWALLIALGQGGKIFANMDV